MFPFFIFSVFEMHDLIEMKDKEENSFFPNPLHFTFLPLGLPNSGAFFHFLYFSPPYFLNLP